MNKSDIEFLTKKIDIKFWLNKYKVKNYTINEDLSVDVKGNVNLSSGYTKLDITRFPLKFRNITGDFSCDHCLLESLVGAPLRVEGDFYCGDNKLKSLVGAPEFIGGAFGCEGNFLTNLCGSPKYIYKDFDCSFNKIHQLNEMPNFIGGDFYCSWNNIENFDGIAKKINGDIRIFGNKILSLENLLFCDFGGVLYFNIDYNNFSSKEILNKLKQFEKNFLVSSEGIITLRVERKEFDDHIKPIFEKHILKKILKKKKNKNNKTYL